VLSVYFTINRIGTFALFFLYVIGVDLYENMTLISILAGLFGVVTFHHMNSTVGSLIPLVLSNPFYVGEIISISRAGAAPADIPSESLVGFVESISWGYVVLRDFKLKQTFIPHHQFADLIIHNWSRRPTKQCRFVIRFNPNTKDSSAMPTLMRFLRKWIESHPEIDQKRYKKAVLKGGEFDAGMKLEVVFYPAKGKKHHPLRAEFMVTLLEAAKRFNLEIMPSTLFTSFPNERDPEDDANPDARHPCNPKDVDHNPVFDELFPSKFLRRRAGFHETE